MRVLFLNHNLIWRGTFFRAYLMARELAKRGHEVDLWTVSKRISLTGETRTSEGVRIWCTPRWWKVGKHDGGYAPLDILTRSLRIQFGQWDIIHAFDHRPNVSFPWYVKRLLAPRLSSPVRGEKKGGFCADWCDWWTGGGITTGRRRYPWIDRLEQRLEEGSKRSARLVTVISSVLYDRACALGIEPDRLLLLPSGADVDGIPCLDEANCKEIVGLRKEDPVLCFVGYSLWDVELISEAFARVRESYPSCQLLIVGGGVEAPALESVRKRFRVGYDVYLPGDVPYRLLPKFLGAATVHLLPLNDTLANRARVPNKLGDYMASGRPIAACDVGDSGCVIKENRIGQVSGVSAESFAEAILGLLKMSSDQRMEMGRRARALAEGEYSWASAAARLEEAYARVLR